MSVKEAVLKLRIDTILGDMSKAVNGLQQGLEKGVTKIDVGTALGKSMSKNLQAFKEEYSKFSQLTAGGTQVKISNSKEAIQSGERLIKVYRDIQAQVESMGGATTENLKKLFPESFDSRIKEVRNSLTSLQSSMLALGVKQTALTEATNEAARLKGELDGLKGQLVDTKDKITALENAEKALASANTDQTKAEENLKKVSTSAEQTKTKFEQLRQEFVRKIDLNATGVKKEIDDIEKEVNDLITKREQLSKAGDNAGAAKVQKDIDAKNKAIDRKNSEYKKLTDASINAMNAKDLKALSKQTQFAGVNPKQIEESKAQVQALAQEQTKAAEQVRAAEQSVADAKLKTKEATDQQKNAKDALDAANSKNTKTLTEIDRVSKAYDQQTAKVTQLTAEITNMQTKMSTKGLADLKELIPGFDENRLKTTEGIQGIITELERMDNQKADKVRQELEHMGINAKNAETNVDGLRSAFAGIGNAAGELTRAQKDLDMLRHRLEYFFGITNSIQLFKRAVRSALNTVKELDKTMTEAAVVTKFDVSDMWNQLPIYAKHAQNLGVSINGMYQATTLYYQQGLKTNEAMELGVETMKMAKIAGIESADATKAMTAALRGFNMELNETSATRVNDVYSQLAAVTAADTAQISTAMEKTASIAASANMEFETTAALLAQIIETTQEAPETAGTAMKTIIARFAEVKSLREKGLMSGEDEEGEAIDVNKIQTALRTVGISMEGFFSGSEGLDSVLLKLAEKWNTLDFETQRYIATMAAGSRQQSRFIAMMSDYGRTSELVERAHNSAGASQKQFEKTLDSMENKLQRLTNAWNTFTMGLANNEILKGAVDILTNIIEGINSMTDAISGGSGLIKSITSLAVAIGALTFGRNTLSMLFGGAAAKGVGKFGKMLGLAGVAGAVGDQTQQKEVGSQKRVQGVTFGESLNKAVVAPVKSGVSKTWAGLKTGTKFVASKAARQEMIQQHREQRQVKQIQAKENNFKQYASARADQLIAEGDKNGLGNSLKYINKQVEEGKMSVEDAAKSYQKLGQEVKVVNGQIEVTAKGYDKASMSNQKFVQGTQTTAKALGSMSSAMFVAGGACAGLSALLSAMGYDEAAEEVSKLSGILMGLGAIFMILPPIVTTVGKVVAATGITAQAAWGWIGIILALIAALAVAIIALSKSGKSLEKRLEENNKQLQEMKTAAEEAQTALDQLTDTRDQLEKMRDTFEGLRKGTDEWRQALIKSNNQVLELLAMYPFLNKYIEFTDEGLATIKDAGYEELLRTQQEAIINSQFSSSVLQMQNYSLQREEINTKFESGDISKAERDTRLNNLDRMEELQMSAITNNILALDKSLSNMAFGDEAANLASYGSAGGITTEMFNKQIQKDGKDYSEAQKDELIAEYQTLTGKTEEQVQQMLKDEQITYDDINASVSAYKTGQAKAKEMTQIAKQLSKIEDKEKRTKAEKLFSKEAGALKTSDIADLKKVIGEDFTPEKIQQYLKEEFEIELDWTYIVGLTDALISVDEKIGPNGSLMTELSKLGFSEDSQVKQLLGEMDYSTATGFVKEFYRLQGLGVSNTQLESLMGQIGTLKEDANLTDEEYESVLQYLGDIQWNNWEDLLQAKDFLENMGLEDKTIQTLINSMENLTDVTSNNTEAQLQQKKWQISDLIEQLKSGKIKQGSITTEQRDQLVDTGYFSINDFKENGLDSFVYDGNLYADLVVVQGKLVNNLAKDGEKEKEWDKSKEFIAAVEGIDGDENGKGGAEDAVYSFSSTFFGDEDTGFQGYYGASYEDYMADAATDLDKETKRDDLDAWYKYLAKALGETPEEGLESYQQYDKIQEWLKIYYFEKDVREQEATQESAESGNKLIANTDITTTQAGYQIYQEDGLNETYSKAYRENIDLRLESVNGEGFLEGISEDLKKVGKETEDFNTAAKALASDLAITSTKTKKLGENLEGLLDDLSKKKTSPEYQAALKQAKINVADYFGVSLEDLDAAGINEELYGELAKGDPKALKKVQQLIAKSVLDGYSIGAKQFSQQDFSDMAMYLSANPVLDEKGMQDFKDKFGIDLINMTEEARKQLDKALSLVNVQVSFARDDQGNVTGIVSNRINRSGYTNDNAPKGGSKWKNSFDKFYNVYEEINKLIREREKLERRYDKLLEKRGTTAEELVKNSREELANLEEQRKNQELLLKGKQQQAYDLTLSKKGQKYDKYYDYNKETGQISIKWDLVNKLKGKKGEGFEEFINELTGLRDQFQEAEDALFDIEDQIQEILERGKDEYLDLENQVKDALINSRQKEIDKLSEINDSINDTNSRLLDSMQEQIDEYRQNRDNEKTEEEIADKQRRLAYLQMDTSGANATEILQLQKEIDEAQEDYTDTLIDQKISELQKQNDQAAEQRQRQIDILQAQLDYYESSGAVWEFVNKLIEGGIDKEGGLVEGSDLESLLKDDANYEGLSNIQKMEWMEETNDLIAQGLLWLSEGAVGDLNAGKTIEFKNADGQTVSGKVGADGSVTTEDGSVYTDVEMDSSGKYSTKETAEQAVEEGAKRAEEEKEKERQKLVAEYGSISSVSSKIDPGHSNKKNVQALQAALKWLGYYDGEIDGNYPKGNSKLREAVYNFKRDEGLDENDITVGKGTRNKFKAYKFETGGLADFTGPAWLDGTKSKPEYILNADQTKAFFNLIDVLGSLQNGGAKTVQNSGDNTYDIDINVESIGSDYDVEQLADKVKSLINEDARYRNNNTINLMR